VKVIQINSLPSAQKTFSTFIASTVVMILKEKMSSVAEKPIKPVQGYSK